MIWLAKTKTVSVFFKECREGRFREDSNALVYCSWAVILRNILKFFELKEGIKWG
jgi:hypothetical protein